MKKQKEKIYEYEVLFEGNGSGYTVTVPKLPGLVTEGGTLKEARIMAKDAIRCHIEAALKDTLLSASKKAKRTKLKVAAASA